MVVVPWSHVDRPSSVSVVAGAVAFCAVAVAAVVAALCVAVVAVVEVVVALLPVCQCP